MERLINPGILLIKINIVFTIKLDIMYKFLKTTHTEERSFHTNSE